MTSGRARLLATLTRIRLHAATALLAVMAAMTMGVLVSPSSALAGSGDIEGCIKVLLYPNTIEDAQKGLPIFCTGSKFGNAYHEYYHEVESWNSNAEGDGSCAGVSKDKSASEVLGEHCTGELPLGNYDESYCIQKCEGWKGWAFVRDNSKWHTYYTLWASWA